MVIHVCDEAKNCKFFHMHVYCYILMEICFHVLNLNCIMTKPGFWVSDQVRYELGCTATADGESWLEAFNFAFRK